MNNYWNEMFDRQRIHWARERHKYVQDPIEMHRILCLSIIKEVCEVLDCEPWKLHRKSEAKSKEELLEELIDVFKFWLCLVVHHGFEPDQVFQEFQDKSDIVEMRAQ